MWMRISWVVGGFVQVDIIVWCKCGKIVIIKGLGRVPSDPNQGKFLTFQRGKERKKEGVKERRRGKCKGDEGGRGW